MIASIYLTFVKTSLRIYLLRAAYTSSTLRKIITLDRYFTSTSDDKPRQDLVYLLGLPISAGSSMVSCIDFMYITLLNYYYLIL